MFTLIILTKNKPYFIKRMLGYYKHSQFIEQICICDWSDSNYLNQNKSIIEEFQDTLHVSYVDVREWIGISAIEHIMKMVDTKYVSICRDTDFLVPQTISLCMEVLESSPEYSIAHGKTIGFNLHSFGAFGEFLSTHPLPQVSLSNSCSLQRLQGILDGHTGLLNGVFRTNQLREIIQISQEEDQEFAEPEFVPECLSVMYGKVKLLNSLLLVRQLYLGDLIQGSWFDYKTYTLCNRSYSDRLSSIFSKYFDDISLSKLKGTISRVDTNSDVNSKLVIATPRKIGVGYLGLAKIARRVGGKMINSIPICGWIWRKSQPIRQGQMYKTSLQGLLSPRCPHYLDFMPIYKIVTQPPLSAQDSSNDSF